MSEIREILAGVQTDRQIFTGDSVRNLRTGISFIAELEEIQDIELNTELGRDARESITLHVADRVAAAGCQMNDQIEVVQYGAVCRFQILRHSDNPTSFQVDFGCMKVTEKDS